MRKAIVAAVMAAAIALPGSAALASTPSKDRGAVTSQVAQSKRDAKTRDRKHHHDRRGGRDSGLDR